MSSFEVTRDMHQAVTSARESGQTWAQCAAPYGVSWQALRAAYGRYVPASPAAPSRPARHGQRWQPRRLTRARRSGR
jgi:hypothetical protein